MKLPINIKNKQPSMPVYAGIGLLMLCIALFCLFTPFIPPFSTGLSKNLQTAYMILGGIGTMFFAFVTSYSVFNIISPPVGITISEAGIYEYTVAGNGAGFIPKEAITSLKTFGKDKRQYLGINIDPAFVNDLGEGIAAKTEITNNVQAGIPAVIIRQNDVYVTVDKLLKLIIEAYTEEEKVTEDIKEPLPQDVDQRIIVSPEKTHVSSIGKNDEVIKVSHVASSETASTEERIPIKPQEASLSKPDKTNEAEEIKVNNLSPSPNVIKTVDELLAKLNIPIRPQKSDKNEDNDR